MFKKDFIKVTAMRRRRQLMNLHINPYPDALLRRGLKRREAWENPDLILEESMMYTTMVGVMLHRMADIIDMVDGMVLQTLENKADVDRKVVQLQHHFGNVETRVSVVEEWKDDMTVHMQETGEQYGEDHQRIREMEERVNQLQALLVAQGRKMEVMSDVIRVQNEAF